MAILQMQVWNPAVECSLTLNVPAEMCLIIAAGTKIEKKN